MNQFAGAEEKSSLARVILPKAGLAARATGLGSSKGSWVPELSRSTGPELAGIHFPREGFMGCRL